MKNYIILLLTCFFTPQLMNSQLKPISYKDGTTKLNGISAKPKQANSQNPGILILPAWKGIDTNTKEVAEALSKLGYHAFIADIYGEGNYPKDAKEASTIAGKYKQDYKSYLNRIDLACKELIKLGANADNLVIIGYCFGGTGVLEAARANMPFKGVVSFHGGLGRDSSRIVETIQSKVLVCHGADDPFVSEKEVLAFQQEMKNSKADWQMIYYANAVHAFTEKEAGSDNSKGAAYNEAAAKRSWQHMLLFLNETMTK